MEKDTICDKPRSLVTETKRLVKEAQEGGESLYDIGRRADVPWYWLRKFAAGEIGQPSANRVQHLFEKLSGRKVLAK